MNFKWPHFTIKAKPGDRLHFAVMFIQSNDLFYAPRDGGIALFDNEGRAVSGDALLNVPTCRNFDRKTLDS